MMVYRRCSETSRKFKNKNKGWITNEFTKLITQNKDTKSEELLTMFVNLWQKREVVPFRFATSTEIWSNAI
jgi:hypothetical protein